MRSQVQPMLKILTLDRGIPIILEYVEELTVNSDQEIVDIKSNLSGYKEFEGQIIASGNESIAFNYGNPLNMFFMSSK